MTIFIIFFFFFFLIFSFYNNLFILKYNFKNKDNKIQFIKLYLYKIILLL